MHKNFSLDLKVGDREATVTLLSVNGDKIEVAIDDRIYDLDIVMVERGVYSILYRGESFNIELIEADSAKHYTVNTYKGSYDVELIDSESRYMKNRNDSIGGDASGKISSPMPGKVVSIPVSVGDEVAKDDVIIVISAMKMESDYKSPIDGVVKEIFVEEGDTVNSNQLLVVIE